jgi:lipopolysaccharide export system protein LptC
VSKRGILILVLLGAALVTSMLVWRMQPQPKPPPPEVARSDYTLENFELVTLDDEGKESFSVRAPKLVRDPQGKALTITAPKFSFPGKGKDGGRWNASAGTAWVGPKGDKVRLLRDVDLVGPPGPLGVRTRMQTAQLEILPKRDYASSPAVVTITRGDSILTGKGLQANLATHRVEFLADVKGRYAPRRR